jgi:GrpB-like predicted nucleotidyltransferase (UPF0157 family)
VWNENVKFRDYLREHPEDARTHSNLKQKIVKEGIFTLLKYSELKKSFVSKLLDCALAWADERQL